MNNLPKQLAEIFEIETIDENRNFTEYDEWDSLAALSVLAILDSDYGINLTQKQLEEFPTISDFINFVETNTK